MGSSQTRARTRVPCTGRQILNHCATREAPAQCFRYYLCQLRIYLWLHFFYIFHWIHYIHSTNVFCISTMTTHCGLKIKQDVASAFKKQKWGRQTVNSCSEFNKWYNKTMGCIVLINEQTNSFLCVQNVYKDKTYVFKQSWCARENIRVESDKTLIWILVLLLWGSRLSQVSLGSLKLTISYLLLSLQQGGLPKRIVRIERKRLADWNALKKY